MMKNISAGTLRHLITWQTVSSNSGSSVGQNKPTYTTLGTYAALVEAIGGDEVENAAQRKAIRHYKVTTRNWGTVKPTDQILWTDANGISRTLNVKNTTLDPFGIMLEIECTELITNN